MMRNIFLKCFNTYKSDSESSLSDSFALKHMKFSPRLFEVKLSQRVETAAYFQDTDTFVVAEGEAARCYNIHTGNDGLACCRWDAPCVASQRSAPCYPIDSACVCVRARACVRACVCVCVCVLTVFVMGYVLQQTISGNNRQR